MVVHRWVFGGRWCPRSESNRHAFKGGGFSYHFGFRRPERTRRQGSWSGARLHHSLLGLRCPPSALYTFPARLRGLGSASARVRKPLRAFTEFDGLHPEDFSPGAQVVSSESAASTNSATRASSAHPCPNRTGRRV